MALSFPSNPTLNQTYSYGGITYTFDSKRWVAKTNTVSAASTNVSLANVAPSNPVTGQLWLNQDTGTVAVYALGGWVSIGSIMSTIAAGTVTGTMLANNTVTAQQIASGTITSTQLSAGAVTSTQLSTGAVTAVKIADGTITAGKLVSGTITGTQIASNTISASKIVDYTITGQQIANTITLSNLTVSGNTTLGSVGNVKITGGTSGQLLTTDGTGNLSFATAPVPTVLGEITVSNAAVFSNTATFNGLVTVTQSAETVSSKTAATGVVAHDLTSATTFYHTSPSANFTANFTNVSSTNNRVIVAALVISQGATAYVPTAVQIDGVAQTIKWISSTAPTGTASKVDIISFSFLRSGGAWLVMGQYSNYG